MTCDYADCRVPPSRHNVCAAKDISPCWQLHITHLGHQHTPKRSQGGKECWVMLCAGHHDCIDNGTRYEGLRLSDHIVNWSDGRRTYQIRSRDGDKEVLVELEL